MTKPTASQAMAGAESYGAHRADCAEPCVQANAAALLEAALQREDEALHRAGAEEVQVGPHRSRRRRARPGAHCSGLAPETLTMCDHLTMSSLR